jgi:hypothetical protein
MEEGTGALACLPDARYGLGDLVDAFKGETGAIVGCGTSIEGFDFETLRSQGVGLVVGVNECVKFLRPDILVLRDEVAVPKLYRHLHPETTVVMATRTLRWIAGGATTEHEAIQDTFRSLRRLYVAEFEREVRDRTTTLFYDKGSATGALSLARCVGLARCYLYGFDFYRRIDQQYAYHCNVPNDDEVAPIPAMPGYYSSYSLTTMCASIAANMREWDGTEFINRSRYSRLTCFPIDPIDSLPRAPA